VNTQSHSQKLDLLLQEIEGIKLTQQQNRRLRADVAAETLPALLALLRGRAGFVHLSAISCVDWIDEGQFELVYHLWSYESNLLISAHIRIPRDPGIYLSVFDIYTPAAFFERDIHEMFGLYFEGSPDMSKFILTEWNGPPPMRKEFNSEKWVMETFNWQEYQPDWLTELEQRGGGVVLTPDTQRREGGQ
jgi:NADH-quinone oxidoreductase subunit C